MAVYLVLALVRWQLPWTPQAPYQQSWWGLAVVALAVECFAPGEASSVRNGPWSAPCGSRTRRWSANGTAP
ncbi:hypothetical protein GCM10009599_04560 [Luteococcus peritonei]